jgi:hypothetical protein
MNEFRQQLKPITAEGETLLNKLKIASAEVDDIAKKEFKIRQYKATAQAKAIEESEELLEANQNIRPDLVSPSYWENLRAENTDYFESAQNCPDFLNEHFRDMVPYFSRNLILLGARSGQGKSTIAGNLSFHTIKQNKNVLVLTNEEIDSDVYNRVTCLVKGWGYTNHRKFTKEQIDEFNDMYEKLGKRLTVISDKYNGKTGTTTTLEGIIGVLDSLLRIDKKYDVIIIDYFQNISVSLKDITAPEWKVLDKLGQYLDNYRKLYNAPIILLSQLKDTNLEDPAPFKDRIERCKSIYNKVTCAIEVTADVENSKTDFKCHKSRFTSSIGTTISAGFDKGKYVLYDSAFKNKTLLVRANQDQAKFLEQTMKAKVETDK